MTGIHGQCQVQVDMWIFWRGAGMDFFSPLKAKPGGLIQSITGFWEVVGLDPLCCK